AGCRGGPGRRGAGRRGRPRPPGIRSGGGAAPRWAVWSGPRGSRGRGWRRAGGWPLDAWYWPPPQPRRPLERGVAIDGDTDHQRARHGAERSAVGAAGRVVAHDDHAVVGQHGGTLDNRAAGVARIAESHDVARPRPALPSPDAAGP